MIMVPPATISSLKVKTSLSAETEVTLSLPLSILAGSAHSVQLTFCNFNNPGGIEFTATYTSWQTLNHIREMFSDSFITLFYSLLRMFRIGSRK